MEPRVLLVDDDEHVLAGYYRALHRMFSIDIAAGGEQALQALAAHGPYAVLVADMRMPGVDGLELLRQAQDQCPDTVRIMLTGNVDQRTAMDAVNEGQVFRFLTKPCPSEALARAIASGIRQYQLIRNEKDLLEQTLGGAVSMLTDLLSSLDPEAFGHAQMLREQAESLARALKIESVWEIGLATVLSPIGRLTLPPDLLRSPLDPHAESASAQSQLQRVPEFGAQLVARIPRLDRVAEIIRYQAKGFDGSGFPNDDILGRAIPVGARILKPLADLQAITPSRHSQAVALEELRMHAQRYDPEILDMIFRIHAIQGSTPSDEVTQPVRFVDLRPGHVLASNVVTTGGRLVLMAGVRLSTAHLQLLSNLAGLMDLREPIFIR